VAAVHLAAAKGVNTHLLAKRYGFVYQTLRRHLKLHLSESTRTEHRRDARDQAVVNPRRLQTVASGSGDSEPPSSHTE
jgi:hypothetical protein